MDQNLALFKMKTACLANPRASSQDQADQVLIQEKMDLNFLGFNNF